MLPVTICLLAAIVAQDATDPLTAEQSQRQLRLDHMRATTTDYEFQLGDDEPISLTLAEQPIFRWNDPVIDVVDGVLYVVTNRQRPAAVLSVWMRSSGLTHNQYQLLTDQLLVAARKKEKVWHPAVGRIIWQPVAEAPQPADIASKRLVQMRAIARQFSGHVFEELDDAGRFELRLLTSPLYRYEDSATGVIDGGIFVLVKGTNPEVTLVLEAVKDADGLRWQYLLSPLTNRRTELQYRGTPIWTYRHRHDPMQPFYDIIIRAENVDDQVD